jgi:hypothetical protein
VAGRRAWRCGPGTGRPEHGGVAGITPSTVRPARGPGRGRRPHRPQGRRLLPLLGGWRPVVAVADMVRLAGIRAGASRAGCLARLVKVDHRAGPRGGRTPAGARTGSGRAGDSFQVCTLPSRTALGVSLGVTLLGTLQPAQRGRRAGRLRPPRGSEFLDRTPSVADVGAPPWPVWSGTASTSGRATTPGQGCPRGRSPDRAGRYVQPVSGADGRPQGAHARTHPRTTDLL